MAKPQTTVSKHFIPCIYMSEHIKKIYVKVKAFKIFKKYTPAIYRLIHNETQRLTNEKA